MSRRIPVAALLIASLTVLIMLAGIVQNGVKNGPPDLPGALGLLGIGTFLVFPAMGLLLVRHQPANAVGWLLLGIGLTVYSIFNFGDFAVAFYSHRNPLPISQIFAFLEGTIWIPFILMLLLFLPMLFPDGHLLSRRWLVPITSGLTFALCALLGNVFVPTNVALDNPGLANPLANPSLARTFEPLVNLAVPFGLVALIGSVASVVVRYRRGNSLQRHQIRWFLFALLLAAIPFMLNDVNHTLSNILLVLLVPLLPISIAIAVLRYRLYDIDLVINRALVYSVLAAFISAVYVAIVVGIGRLIGSANQPNLALSIVATAVVAVAFQPVRERVQRFANRLVYGRRATPYEVMAGFADQMARTLSSDHVLPQMAEAAARGVAAQAARVTLLMPGGGERSVTWPPEASPDLFPRLLPIEYRGEPVGEIAIRETPGQPITTGEARLLADLAVQAGLVMHNVRLAAELQAQLEQLIAQSHDLQASRQRIVSAQETERRRLEEEIRQGVQRELETIAAELDDADQLLERDQEAVLGRLEGLVTATQQTLDRLRELARGIFPPILADKGLFSALQAQLRKASVAVSLEAPRQLENRRFDPDIETAVYFTCLEALRRATPLTTIRFGNERDSLRFFIDGLSANGDLVASADRIAAVGGELRVQAASVEGLVPALLMLDQA